MYDDNVGRHRSPRRHTKLQTDVFCAKLICTAARLSSVQWADDSIIGCGDYDGVLTEWHVERGYPVLERDGHGGKRVLSLEYSIQQPSLCASASDDGTIRLWAAACEQPVMAFLSPTGAPICAARFHHTTSHMIAAACSDSNIYVFDMRRPTSPALRLAHHRRPVSNIRFLGPNHVVSASIDSTLQLWDISSVGRPLRTFAAHRNFRNFVGLSVLQESGLLACGSETNEAFVYDKRWAVPMLSHPVTSSPVEMLHSSSTSSSCSVSSCDSGKMVSAVCLKQSGPDCTLLAANSEGNVEILDGHFEELHLSQK
ncbi:hypothetical protein KP509_06G069200 [Ceratopteris richardii]|uniref:Uncharacterized protein n=1 Tax=Ceratopteris richardii TaxID=49495 RepID=A0A8T2UHG8_CERRI|nr:hypothetical protein KP509_06G069200 [Ceratopteris richardii]